SLTEPQCKLFFRSKNSPKNQRLRSSAAPGSGFGHLLVPFRCAWTNSYARSPMGLQMFCAAASDDRKCTPPQKRLSPQSVSNSVNVAYGPIMMPLAGVTPGSMTEEPRAAGTDHPKLSEPKKRRLAWA